MLSPNQKVPFDYHGFRIIRKLGGGWQSDGYAAQPPPESNLPDSLCLKIGTDKTHIFIGAYTQKDVEAAIFYQRNLLRRLDHVYIVKCYPDVLPDIHEVLATELGVIDLVQFQGAFGTNEKHEMGVLPAVAAKYFTAQTFLAVAYLHQRGIKWTDAKQNNIVIMPDFTIRLIDVGTPWSDEQAKRDRALDHHYTAGMLCSLNTTNGEVMAYRDLQWYKATFSAHKHEMSTSLWSLLEDLLNEKPFVSLLSHPYFLDEIDGNSNTSIDLAPIFGGGNEVVALDKLRYAAWKSLPFHARECLVNLGVNDLSNQEGQPATTGGQGMAEELARVIALIGLHVWRLDVDRQVYNSPVATQYRSSLRK